MNVTPNLIMLAVVGVTGSIMFAAERASTSRQGEQTTVQVKSAAPSEPKDVQEDGGAPIAAAQTSPTPPEAAAEEDKPSKPAAAGTTAKSTADNKPSPQRFVPSEEVRPDFDVSFPVDI